MRIKNNFALTASIILVFLAGFAGGSFFSAWKAPMGDRAMVEKMKQEMSDREKGESTAEKPSNEIKKLLAAGKYKCCLNKPCSYCLKEGECECLDSIMNGKHPCGECIGEILEGEGNPLLAEYFASALAEEIGEKYKPVLKQIIADKYDMPTEKQL